MERLEATARIALSGLASLVREAWANPLTRWRAVFFLVALAPRVLWVAYTHRLPVGLHDPVFYDFVANGLAAGEGYINPYTGATTAYFPPGYPLFLAAVYFVFGRHVIVAELFNAVLGSATVVLTYELARRLAGPSVAAVAGVTLAFFPGQVFYTGTLLSEILFTFLLMGGLLALLARPWQNAGLPWPWLAVAGVLFGAASLVRPVALLVPAVLLVYWLLTTDGRRAATQTAVVVLPVVLVLLPWTVRNLVSMDAFILISTNAGDDFCIGNHEGATGGFVFTGPCYEGYEGISDPREREVEAYREGFRRGLEFIVNYPLDELGLLGEKAYALVRGDDDGLAAVQSYGDDPFIEAEMGEYLSTAANAYYFIVIGWAGLGLLLWLRPGDPRRVVSLLVPGYILVVPLVFFADARFHFPVIPMLTVLAATGVVSAWRGRSLGPHGATEAPTDDEKPDAREG